MEYIEQMTYRNKYHFEELTIGESIHIIGKIDAIRSSASMWGSRYGIWLRVKKAPQGGIVSRVSDPLHVETKRNLSIAERLSKQEDALRFISLMLIKIKDMIEDKE